MATTFDPTVDASDNTYTNGNKTVERTAAPINFSWAVSNSTRDSGKRRFEILVDSTAGGLDGLGICRPGYDIGSVLGNGTDEVIYRATGERIIEGSSSGAWGEAWQTGDVIAVEFDIDASPNPRIEFFNNGVSQGLGDEGYAFERSVPYHVATQQYHSGNKQTGRWTAADQTGTPTAGFVAWDDGFPDDGTIVGAALAGDSHAALRARLGTLQGAALAGGTFSWTSAGAVSIIGNAIAGGTFDAVKPYPIGFSLGNTVRAVLTGWQNGLADLVLPCTNFSASVRVDGENYASAICAQTPGLADAIAARPDGDLIIYAGTRQSTGDVQLVELVNVNFEELRTDRGARSARVTLVGYKSQTYGPGVPLAVPDAIYSARLTAGKRVRVAGLSWLAKPGDTITSAGETFVAAVINYSAARQQAATEFAEA